MNLDGSESKDPDNPSNKTGIIYSWSCRKKGEELPSEFDPPNPTGGCWGTGIYTLNSTQDKVKVYTGDFFQNAIYIFKLTCTKDSRSSSFEQSVTILPGQPPTMSLRYSKNGSIQANYLRCIIEYAKKKDEEISCGLQIGHVRYLSIPRLSSKAILVWYFMYGKNPWITKYLHC